MEEYISSNGKKCLILNKIDSKELAYTIGFICADGSIDLLNRVDMSKGSGYGYDYNDYYYKHRTGDAKTTNPKTVTATLRSLKLM